MQEISFSEDYFKGEEIEGFYVEEKMKRAWAAFVKVLSVFDDFCEKNNLRYYAGYGTLLGAVRHKGFIPWDDDIDLLMPRDDYYRLLDLARANKIPKGFRVDNVRFGNVDMFEQVAAFANYGDSWKPEELRNEYYGCPYIIGLDVFVMTPIPSDPNLQSVQRGMYNIIHEVAENYDSYYNAGTLKDLVCQIEELTKSKIYWERDVRLQLWDLSVKVLTMFPENECDSVVCGFEYFRTEKYSSFKQKSWFDEVTYLPFEGGFMLPVAKEYEKVIINDYGPNYMTPVKGGADHDYPFYKRQDEFLKENFGIVL